VTLSCKKSAKTIEKGSRSCHPEVDQSAVSLAMRFRKFREDLQSRRMQHPNPIILSCSNSSCFAQPPPTLVLTDFWPRALISLQARASKLTLVSQQQHHHLAIHTSLPYREALLLPRITGSQMSHMAFFIIRVPVGRRFPNPLCTWYLWSRLPGTGSFDGCISAIAAMISVVP
jgi:hypothetical protein